MRLLALNPLNQTDIVFFVVLAVIIVLCIGVYFLIPVINKKQYKEMRDNLHKRETAFRSNVRRTDEAAKVEGGKKKRGGRKSSPGEDEKE